MNKVENIPDMNCLDCLLGYYYDTCNANWKSEEEYKRVLETHKCQYFQPINKKEGE